MNNPHDLKVYLGIFGIILMLVVVPLTVTTQKKHQEFEAGFTKKEPVAETFTAITFVPGGEGLPKKLSSLEMASAIK